MLTYLIKVTDDILAVSVIIGVIFAFVDHFLGERRQKILRTGFIVGIIAAGIRAYITNTKRLVGGWKVGTYGYAAALCFFVLFIAVFIIFSKRIYNYDKDNKKSLRPGDIAVIILSLLVVAYIYCTLPNTFVYPFRFDTGGNGLLSTDYLFRLGGYILGILVSVLSGLAVYKVASVTARKGFDGWLKFAFFFLNILYTINNFSRLMLVLTARNIVKSTALFTFAAESNNRSYLYTFVAFGIILLMSILILIKSKTLKEPYSTKAEHRKQKALWRTGKRYSVLLVLCFICGILCATWFVDLNTVVIREAPVEEPILVKNEAGEDSELHVPLEMICDGHLHRFGYTTDEGYNVRFIVILKQPNTTNYGIGLDACEICGEAGYYENNEGRVVCKKCGVVMNTTTIGMKGGCNPIIIDYDITDSYITVPVIEMVKNETRFKK